MDNNTVIESLAARLNRDKKDAEALLEGFSAVIREHLSEMDSVQLPGFGIFYAIKEEEKIVDNSSTGMRVLLPPAIKAQFSPSAILKRKISD